MKSRASEVLAKFLESIPALEGWSFLDSDIESSPFSFLKGDRQVYLLWLPSEGGSGVASWQCELSELAPDGDEITLAESGARATFVEAIEEFSHLFADFCSPSVRC